MAPAIGSTLSDGSASQRAERQGGVLLSKMGCNQPDPDPDRPSSSGHGENEEICRPVCGRHSRPGQHSEVPQPAALRRPEDDSMASPGVPTLRRVADSVGDPGGMQSLESTGSITQGAHDASESSGAAVEEPLGQGEECMERQNPQMTNVDLFDRHELLTALSTTFDGGNPPLKNWWISLAHPLSKRFIHIERTQRLSILKLSG